MDIMYASLTLAIDMFFSVCVVFAQHTNLKCALIIFNYMFKKLFMLYWQGEKCK